MLIKRLTNTVQSTATRNSTNEACLVVSDEEFNVDVDQCTIVCPTSGHVLRAARNRGYYQYSEA